MPWDKGENLIAKQLRRHGLDKAVAAGIVCNEAERLYPDLFKATALVDGTLRITTPITNQVQFRAIEGRLLAEVAAFAKERNLPIPTRIRLTIQRSSDTLGT